MPIQLTISGSDARRVAKLIVISGLLAAVILLSLSIITRAGRADFLPPNVKSSRYQAVFLTNDRVYFGHVRAGENGYFELRDAYFIRETSASKTEKAKQVVAAVGEEFLGPERHLTINSEQVILIENLRRDSNVAAAISRIRKDSTG